MRRIHIAMVLNAVCAFGILPLGSRQSAASAALHRICSRLTIGKWSQLLPRFSFVSSICIRSPIVYAHPTAALNRYASHFLRKDSFDNFIFNLHFVIHFACVFFHFDDSSTGTNTAGKNHPFSVFFFFFFFIHITVAGLSGEKVKSSPAK